MDERKRTYEPSDSGTGQLKRLRPEDILGIQKDEPHKVVTRLFLSRSHYSKIIGRGGQMIVQIRAFTGASLRCSELDEDNRLVLIIGSLVQVLNAFDVIIQVISPTIVQANSSGQRPLSLSPASSGNQGEPVMVCLLLEQGKTGRVVGSKGSTLLALKQRSGATVRVEKETTEYCGVALRKVSVEGANQSVRLVHYLLHELFVDPQTAAMAVDCVPHLRVFSTGGGGGGGGGHVAGLEDLSLRPYMPTGSQHRDFNRDSYSRDGYGHDRESSVYSGRDSYRDGYRDSYRDNSRERDRVRSSNRGGDGYYDHNDGGDSLAMSSFGRSLPGPGAILRSPSPDPSPYRSAYAHAGGSNLQQASRYGPGGGGSGSIDQPIKSVPKYMSNTPHLQQQQQHLPTTPSNQLDHPRRSIPPSAVLSQVPPPQQQHEGTTEAATEVPFPALVGYGVPPETVKQLIDMQAYLLQQFGLKLGTTKRVSAPHMDTPSAVTGTAMTRIRRDSAAEDPHDSLLRSPLAADADQTVEAVLAHKREANPRDLFLAIPRACVGGVIGRGGQLLRDMQAEFNVKVYVEKEEYSGQRIVRLTYLGGHASNNISSSSGAATSATATGRKGTVKRSAAGSDEDDEETDRHGHDAHKRNRRDESTSNREEEDGQGGKDHKDMDSKDKDRDGGTLSSARPSNGPAPKRKGTSEGGDGQDGDEAGNVSKKVRDSSSSSTGGGDNNREATGDEVEDAGDEAESRLKRKRGEASEHASLAPSSSNVGAGADLSDAGLPMRKLVLCKERIEARVEELQKQIADAAGI